MKRTLTVLLLVLTCYTYASTGRYRLTLRDNPATSIVVGWDQFSGSNPVVYYGTTDHGTNWSSYSNSKTPDRTVSYKGMDNNFARITGLQPNTYYYFVIRDSEGTSQRYYFKTAPDNPSERLSFIAGGDSRNNRTPRQNANRLVAKLRPTAVLFGGDMTDSGSTTQWLNWFDDWQLTISSDGRMYPIVATRGNHESSNSMVYDLFDTPSTSVYYALTFGGSLIRTYTLNTEMSISGSQTNWLSSDLASNVGVTWKAAQYHKPMRPHVSSKSEGNNQYNYWANLFYNNDVKLVVECDAHTVKTTWPIRPSSGSGSDEGFIRDDSNGTVYVGEGCWGAPLRSNNDGKNWTRNSGQFNQFKWIFVDQSKIEVRTIRVDNASSVGQVSNSNPFQIPSNLDVWNPSNGSVVTILNNNVTPPTVSLNSPANGAYYSSPQSITLSANASDADGSVSGVTFKVNGTTIGTDNSAPYSISYNIPADGNYSIQATATDNEGNSTDSNVRNITVGVVSQTVERRVSSSIDDVEERSNGDMYTNSSDIELVYDGSRGNQVIGLRFNNVTIPQGASIDRAYVQFTVDETNSGSTSLTIKAHDTDDAAAFTSSSNNVSNRSTTSASVAWNPVAWNSVGQSGADQRTPEMKAVIQEIVDRNGWASGNDMAIIITGTGERTAEAYDGTSSSAALLHVEYTVGGGANPSCESPAILNTGFETNFGNWTNDSADDIDWTRRSGSTPSSGTGPISADEGSYYAYIEASSPNYPSKVANLVSDCVDLTQLNNPELNFRYHMNGGSVGTLNVQVRTDGGSWSTIWQKFGDQGSSWLSATISLQDFASSVEAEIRFNGTTNSSWQGDIVIDAISLGEGNGNGGSSCESSTSDGFESGGTWSNVSGDDLDWTARSGSTPSNNTGPSGASGGSNYVYIESSNPNYPSKTAILESSCYDLSGVSNPSISFDYHMYGGSMGALDLQTSMNGTNWTTIWSISGNQGDNWFSQEVNLSSITSSDVKLRFYATTGSSWQSDICLDNIVVGAGSSSSARTSNEISRQLEIVDLGDEFAQTVKLSPNPSSTDVTFEFLGDWENGVMEIYSINGALVKKVQITDQKMVIGQNELSKGMYIVNVKKGEAVFSDKLIKN